VEVGEKVNAFDSCWELFSHAAQRVFFAEWKEGQSIPTIESLPHSGASPPVRSADRWRHLACHRRSRYIALPFVSFVRDVGGVVSAAHQDWLSTRTTPCLPLYALTIRKITKRGNSVVDRLARAERGSWAPARMLRTPLALPSRVQALLF